MKISLDTGSSTGLFLSLTVFLVFLSCTNNGPDKKREQKPSVLPIHKPGSSFHDSLYLQAPAAVFYQPDSIQLEKIKRITDSSVFESSVHESFYMMRNARKFISEAMPGLLIIDAKNIRFIVVSDSSGKQVIDLDKKDDAWGLILIKKGETSRAVDMANISSELEAYYSTK